MFCNPNYLKNIRKAHKKHEVMVNGDEPFTMEYIGDLPGFEGTVMETVWYNPFSVANIISMAELRKSGRRLTMDTENDAAIFVHSPNGKVTKFSEHASNGLYYCNPNSPSEDVSPYVLLNTVEGNKKMYHRREVERADQAKALFKKLGMHSYERFYHALKNNLIVNCPVSVEDAKRAVTIYGKETAFIKGKTTRRPPTPTEKVEVEPVDPLILKNHGKVTIGVDVFYVQGMKFFHSISTKIKYRTTTFIKNRTKNTLLAETQSAIKRYEDRGFTVTNIHGDQEFACLRDELRPRKMNIVAQDQHVPEVERDIRTIKEVARCIVHNKPYRILPRVMIKKLVALARRLLIMFPELDGISEMLSPADIVEGISKINYHDLKLEFGAYCQVSEDIEPTNTPNTRTTGAICLGPTEENDGKYLFMSLATGDVLTRGNFTELPLPNEAIATVEAMGRKQNQPRIRGDVPLFEWRPGVPINDEEGANTDEDLDAEVPDDDLNANDSDDGDDDDDDGDDDDDDDGDRGNETEEGYIHAEMGPEPTGDYGTSNLHDDDEYDHGNDETGAVDEEQAVQEPTTEAETTEEINNENYSLRPSREPDFSHRYDPEEFIGLHREEPEAANTAHKGAETHGNQGAESAGNEATKKQ